MLFREVFPLPGVPTVTTPHGTTLIVDNSVWMLCANFVGPESTKPRARANLLERENM
jgi:hypothetical protein